MDLDIQGVYWKLIDISKQLSTQICSEEAVWCSRRLGIGQQSSPINVISILGRAHQTRLSLVHLLVQLHFWLVSVHLNNAVACIYIRLDGLQSFSKKQQRFGCAMNILHFF